MRCDVSLQRNAQRMETPLNSVIQICLLVLDASFQFVDVRDLSTRWRRIFRAYDVKVM